MNDVRLILGDCLVEMERIETASVDAIIADLPYGTTACKWDVIIPFDPLWAYYKRIIKPHGVIVLFGSQPFTSMLVMSNLGRFKWEDIWHKSQTTGHLNCRVMPLRQHENILVFGNGRITYNPQIVPKPKENIRPRSDRGSTDCYGAYSGTALPTIPPDMQYPRSVVKYPNANRGEAGLHPNQKPVTLLEYLVKTYTNERDTIVDNVMGSGTTGVAACNLDRNFIGIEILPEYFAIAYHRIKAAQRKPRQLEMECIYG